MDIWSKSWDSGEAIPARYAAGCWSSEGQLGFADNISPHLAWKNLPEGTQSLVLLCQDFDVPSRADDVNQADREVPAELDRVEFFHWVLIDLPPSLGEIAEGAFSQGFTPRGKPGPQGPWGTRQGLNDYTGWFAGDAAMSGSYFGYDGPFPPFNDALVHHYVFTLYAVSVPRLPVEGSFTGQEVLQALRESVLDAANHSGTYTLNRRLVAGS